MNRMRQITSLIVAVIVAAVPTAALAAPPSNDSREGATVIHGLPYSTSQDVKEATAGPDDPSGCEQWDRTVWFSYTATSDAVLVASTAGSDYRTAIQVLEVSGAASRPVVCASDYETRPRGAQLSFKAVENRTYAIAVGRVTSYGELLTSQLAFDLHVQPAVDIVFDHSTFADLASATDLTLTGTATCERAMRVQLNASVQQVVNRRSAWATGTVYIDCKPDPQLFGMAIESSGRRAFGEGDGSLNATAFAHTEWLEKPIARNEEVSVHMCTQIGTVGDDALRGTSGRDRLCALAGDDTVVARGGNDIVYGGAGNDVIRLGGGDDWATGGQGADELLGGPGSDTLAGGEGRDFLGGGKGYDRCNGGNGWDTFGSCEVRKQ